ncbi:hypothetical protein GDO86_003190 [Hymenochirus boettgeri]|uniref:Uncharacterized protein n=1 Tax=Hymenochirus boettgeri TaxID=247094 RepID=A0A8T2JZY7_9PIPI|nr:hypothetical protein GDO86_003190 [Hymenochirus boettgeri]
MLSLQIYFQAFWGWGGGSTTNIYITDRLKKTNNSTYTYNEKVKQFEEGEIKELNTSQPESPNSIPPKQKSACVYSFTAYREHFQVQKCKLLKM